MKKFTVQAEFNGQKSPFVVYIGQPKDGFHPLHFQADWLGRHRGGNITSEFMENVQKLKNLADKNNVSFEELFAYALNNSIDLNSLTD